MAQVRCWASSLVAVFQALVPWMIAGAVATALAHVTCRRRPAAARWAAGAGAALGVRWISLWRLGQCPLPMQRGGDAPSGRAHHVRIVSANLWARTPDVKSIADELVKMQADVVILQEVTARHLTRLEELGALREYPYNAVVPDHGTGGMGVWSRFELSDVDWLEVAGELQIRAWVEPPGAGRVRLFAVHAPAPVPSKIQRWHAWLADMARECTRELGTHDWPIVVAGDFNATVDQRPFRNLLRAGLRDGALATRQGWRMTWSVPWRPAPALFRIDHVLVSRGARFVAYGVGRGAGSDHRPVYVDLAVPARAIRQFPQEWPEPPRQARVNGVSGGPWPTRRASPAWRPWLRSTAPRP